ncbi:phenylalanine--tRNA ligase beta subunit [Nocardioides psychrotolerans]|uniref:Phenylalanine--tRNA ligase beta subunit n=1 Tax=Nocardioides psychrotolerans TaxID=1005945 RepID=A0A1I3KU06_9ACTN|nr:phenylalanine--tRNA ligase subunit beta [Nocardioides psychrotolerans]GEP38570.1 phenylalanine--tRNA ligase beta subunit [Nocardioides psychrotolerans]SFI75860.1 phenylalanyl-tRNA synthetase beta subunit [Nocardioides psychrotolerans]
MKTSVSWIKDYVDLPADVTTEQLAARLTALGLKLEAIEKPGDQITGPLVIGRVLTMEPEPQKNGKTINWCTVDVGDANGTGEPQGIVCGAHNFAPGDLVVCVLPGGVLPGDFAISARKTYGHLSAGMICSSRELGLGGDHDGIIVLPADAGEPGQDAFAVLGLSDEVIEFEINPDRAYALSLRGIARDAALAFDAPFRDPAAREVPPADGAGHPVVVDDPTGCPVFVARTVSGVDPAAPTPDWMVRRLTQAGMRPISLAVDVTNYVMLEIGRPIHGYDADKLTGAIRVRRAQAGERLTTLDGTDRALSPEDLVVTDDSGIIGLGGVMGGESTELSSTTTRILVESAHWDATSMFRTGKRHKLTSEAGKRNERGVDPVVCEAAADRVVELLIAHGGGTAEQGVTVVGTPPAAPSITIAYDLSARITGIEIDADTVVTHLEAVGCTVVREPETLIATAPTWRPDLTDPYDLVEEVARVVGYDQVPSVLPREAAGRGLSREQRLRRRIGRLLAGAGCVEVISFPFVGDATFDALGLPSDDLLRHAVRIANPISSEEPCYTTTLLPGLLKAAARNIGRGAPGVSLFETGSVAFPVDRGPAPIFGVDRRPDLDELAKLLETLPLQPLHLAVVLAGESERAGWWGEGRTSGWADAIAVSRRLADDLGVELEVRSAVREPWHPGRCARLSVGDLVLGHAGELHPKVCKAFGLPARSAAVEIDLDLLMRVAVDVVTGPELSSFPVAKEDVALVVDDSVAAVDVGEALREGAGELLESIRLFDVYTGEQVGEGRKSLAFALRFRAVDRTLTEEETSAVRDSAVAVAAERCGAVQR